MKINGKNASSGTIVVGAGERAMIDLPFGSFSLIFNPGVSPQNVTLNSNPPQIVFDGTDTPLGLASSMTVPLTGGAGTLTFVVYAIGNGDSATRVVHYTASWS